MGEASKGAPAHLAGKTYPLQVIMLGRPLDVGQPPGRLLALPVPRIIPFTPAAI